MTKRLSRREFTRGGAAALLASASSGGILSACGAESAPSASAPPAPRRGGTLNVGVSQVIEDINPWTAIFYRWSKVICPAMYEALVRYENGGKIVPALATAWSHTPDYKTWQFKIRAGVKFHTGADLTANDVAYTFNQINDAKNPSTALASLAPRIWRGAKAIDPETVEIKLATPRALDEIVGYWFIMPTDSRALGNKLAQQSVGTGPYILNRFVHGNRIDLKRNPNYWDRDRPYLDELNFVFLTEIATQVANYRSGAINMLHDVNAVDLKSVTGLDNSKIVGGGTFFHFWMPQLRFGPLASADARVALRYAFDPAKLNAVAWGGKGHFNWNTLDQVTPYGLEQPVDVRYDIDRARQLIKSAGIAGEDVNLHVLNGSTTSSLEAQILVEALKDAGLKSKIVPMDSAAWAEALYAKQTFEGLYNNYGVTLFPWTYNLGNLLYPSILPLPPKYPKSPTPELYSVYAKVETVYEPAETERLMKQAQALMLEVAAVLPTASAQLSEAVPSNLHGLKTTQFGEVRFEGAYLA